ncbi:alpha/beta hydrolase [soil metagenome]
MMRVAARGAMATSWVVKLVGRKRRSGTDAALDPQVAAVLEFERIARLPALDSMNPDAARRYAEDGMSPLELEPVAMAEVIDAPAGGVPTRLFVPHDAGPHWIVYFHGGGGVIGSVKASDSATRYIAHKTKCTVASVDYRLGPEHKHPAAIEDACAAYAALVERLPPGAKIAVAGDSFGGFLAAHVEHWAPAHGVRRPDVQCLIYPVVDLRLVSPSLARLATGYLLTTSIVHWMIGHYMHDHDDRAAASPWFFADLTGSAPAIVATAGYDPLVDEGDAWAERLRAAGTPVRHRRSPSLVHGYLSLAGSVIAARAATDELCRDLGELLAV